MKRPGRPTLTWFLLGAATSALIAWQTIAKEEFPVLSLLPGGAWLVADASCPASIQALHEIRDSPQLRASILIVPAEAESSPVSELACELLGQQLIDRGHWLRILPSDILCNLVMNEAIRFRAEQFVTSPALAYDMVPLPADARFSDLIEFAGSPR